MPSSYTNSKKLNPQEAHNPIIIPHHSVVSNNKFNVLQEVQEEEAQHHSPKKSTFSTSPIRNSQLNQSILASGEHPNDQIS